MLAELPESLMQHCLQGLLLTDVRSCAGVCQPLRRAALAVEAGVTSISRATFDDEVLVAYTTHQPEQYKMPYTTDSGGGDGGGGCDDGRELQNGAPPPADAPEPQQPEGQIDAAEGAASLHPVEDLQKRAHGETRSLRRRWCPVWRALMVSLPQLPNLTAVDFGGANWVTAPLLARLATACPKLRSLNLQRCPTITDADLAELTGAGACCDDLCLIDICFCPKTTYGAVIALRREQVWGTLPELTFGICVALVRVDQPCVALGGGRFALQDVMLSELGPTPTVRRIPSWLCGHFRCPWGELHSYYPDGSFSFSRDTQSKGIVSSLVELPPPPPGLASSKQRMDLQDCLCFIDAPPWMMQQAGLGVKFTRPNCHTSCCPDTSLL